MGLHVKFHPGVSFFPGRVRPCVSYVVYLTRVFVSLVVRTTLYFWTRRKHYRIPVALNSPYTTSRSKGN